MMLGDGFWILIVAALFAGYLLYLSLRRNPEQFTSDNVQKSLWTLGLLALGLIAFIGVMVVGMQLTGESNV